MRDEWWNKASSVSGAGRVLSGHDAATTCHNWQTGCRKEDCSLGKQWFSALSLHKSFDHALHEDMVFCVLLLWKMKRESRENCFPKKVQWFARKVLLLLQESSHKKVQCKVVVKVWSFKSSEYHSSDESSSGSGFWLQKILQEKCVRFVSICSASCNFLPSTADHARK